MPEKIRVCCHTIQSAFLQFSFLLAVSCAIQLLTELTVTSVSRIQLFRPKQLMVSMESLKLYEVQGVCYFISRGVTDLFVRRSTMQP